jgi:hypothetical protein
MDLLVWMKVVCGGGRVWEMKRIRMVEWVGWIALKKVSCSGGCVSVLYITLLIIKFGFLL